MKKREGLVIIVYNLYMLLSTICIMFLPGLWLCEVQDKAALAGMQGLAIGTLVVFAPVVVFRLKRGLQKGFATVTSFVWFYILHGFAYKYFFDKTHAHMTYYSILFIMIFDLFICILIDFCGELREHILQFPQERWLVPNSGEEQYNKIWHSLWGAGVPVCA